MYATDIWESYLKQQPRLQLDLTSRQRHKAYTANCRGEKQQQRHSVQGEVSTECSTVHRG